MSSASPQLVAERHAFSPEDARLLGALRAGDQAAFEALVRRHHATMKRIARSFVAADAVADEVVQETWEAVLRGLDRFERRSSLKTWIFRILINRAKTRGMRERRSTPLSSLTGDDVGPAESADLFQGPDDASPGSWAVAPRPWTDPQRRLASLEVRAALRAAIGTLPPRQRTVVVLRDVEGLSSEEVCELLRLTEANQRVLLHRGRAHLRQALDETLADD